LLVIHGVNEHSGRYAHLAEYFTARGFAVYSLDQIGHGKSEGTRSFVEKFSYLVDDILAYLDLVKEWLPGLPIFPVGHSLEG
jgi:acylglycerol lipase